MSEANEFVDEFIAESREHLDQAEAALLRLAHDHTDAEAINACFRSLHTIKGLAGFLGLHPIQTLAHAAEQTLDRVREKQLDVGHEFCDAMLSTVTHLGELIGAMHGGKEPALVDDAWIKRLERLGNGQSIPTEPPTTKSVGPTTPGSDQRSADEMPHVLATLLALDPTNANGLGAVVRRLELLASGLSPRAAESVRQISHLAGLIASGRGGNPGEIFAQIVELAETLTDAASAEPAPIKALSDKERADFRAEAAELLATAEAIALTNDHLITEKVSELFRSVHTIKSIAAYLGLPRIEMVAHRLEGELDHVRDGKAVFDRTLRGTILVGIDGLRALVEVVGNGGSDAGVLPVAARAAAARLGLTLDDKQVEPEGEAPRLGDVLVDAGVPREVVERAVGELRAGQRLGDHLVTSGQVSRDVVEEAAARIAAARSAEGFARVGIAKLEDLMNLVGELLIAQAMVSEDPAVATSTNLQHLLSRQGRIVDNLQELALGMRMVTLKSTFQKMVRAMHDTSRKLGKKVDLTIVGDDTEIDRTVAEHIADPLLHMIRNAVDHGIESTGERLAAGKSERGRISIEATQAGDYVTIQLRDDGRGMDPQQLRAKAIEKGLIARDLPLSAHDAYQLIFIPGFSTADHISAISGRGVGMDVVKRNIEQIKGRVDIESTIGSGTTFTINLPLTTAILDAMLVSARGQCYLMPVNAIVEALLPEPGQIKNALGRSRLIEHRERILPVFSLGELLDLPEAQAAERELLLVIDCFGNRFGLQVDAILGQQQAVIKPLNDTVIHHAGLTGTAILGDGRVGLILDPAHLVPTGQTSPHGKGSAA